MAKLLDILEHSAGAHAIFNEYDITVYSGERERDDGTACSGWFVRARDYLADDGRSGSRRLVVDHHLELWDEVNCVLSELGVPDDYEGWAE